MKFTATTKELKGKGYTFQKLYASNYITYRKKVECWTIWLWHKGRSLEIDDWYGNTENIINYFEQNIERYLDDNKNSSEYMRTYMVLLLDMKTGEVTLKPMGMLFDIPDNCRNIVLPVKEFRILINEIKWLTR